MARKTQPKPKATTSERPKLTYWQIDRLARGLAFDMMQESETVLTLMVLLDEIAKHPFDNSHVETIANLLNTYLFAYSAEADTGAAKLIAEARRNLLATEKGDR